MLAIGIGCSNFLMSLGGIGLVIAFLWKGKFKESFQSIKRNKRVLAFLAVYLLFVIGLIHTSNLTEGLHQLKIKLPLLIIPVATIVFYPVTQKEHKMIFHFILLGGLISMVTGLLMYAQLIPHEIKDMRSYSPFVSHIRLGTLLTFCVFLCSFLIAKKEYRYLHPVLYAGFILLSLFFLVLLQSLTSIVVLIGCLFVLVIYGIFKKEWRKWALPFAMLFLSIGGYIAYISYQEYHRVFDIETIEINNLAQVTEKGNKYKHFPEIKETINGHYIYINLCYWEMLKAWEKRSSMKFEDNTPKNWPVYESLIRYLTSKGKKKNGTEVEALTDKEIRAIEKGCNNYLELTPFTMRSRINLLWWEIETYQRNGDPNLKSFATRLETWKVASYMAKSSPVIGYGTGDVHDIMFKGYSITQSDLVKALWLDPHQQYLYVLLSFGWIGLILFIGFLYYPYLEFNKHHILFIIALTIGAIGMLDEDMLNTQAGCTQFVFMYVLTYIFSIQNRKAKV